MPLLFISSLVPDRAEFWNPAFARSGNNVLEGIASAISKQENLDILTCQGIPSYPRGDFWIGKHKDVLDDERTIHFAPILNIKIVKNIFFGFYCFFWILKWRIKHRKECCKVLVYNIYTPPIDALYLACRVSGAKLYAILYDLGVPPKRLGLSKASMFAYRLGEIGARVFIKHLDGRIVINESIIGYYAPSEDYILIDGGVNNQVIANLFPLKVSTNNEYIFVCAGMLWDQNGTKLILDAMKLTQNPNIRVVFAGKGLDVSLIEEMTKLDSRITYVGMLSSTELFKLYEKSDVLLNLRIEEEIDFHYPSKLLEYMATGKYVVSTPVAHTERDYGDYLSILKDITPYGLAEKMNLICSMSKEDLYQVGLSARDYMLNNRNWHKRTLDILQYINK